MSSPIVLIIGCGVAGPVMALFLKRKGYRPIVFEKVQALGDAGASLMLMPNGMKVLGLLDSHISSALQSEFQTLTGYWHGTSTGEALADSTLPATFPSKYTQPALGIKRTYLNLRLKNMLLDDGIEVREGWELTRIEEKSDSVIATFSNNCSATGSFLIGCDGIKAASRRAMLEMQGIHEGAPTFTGLVQMAGISQTPVSALGPRGSSMCNWYGQGVHAIAYPVSRTHTSWAVTLPEGQEMQETWLVAGKAELEERRTMLDKRLGGEFEPAVLELVRVAERILAFGLFDRVELDSDQWFSRRCVLVGDAAHPTSPHLGQGANQALEDCYHLNQLIPTLVPDCAGYKESLSKIESGLFKIFRVYAETRQPRTAKLVKEARRLGEQRVVVAGPELCRKRNASIAAAWADPGAVAQGFDQLLREPF
ncbi:hypothetical protein BDV25DRAFT_79150 [Aspergillus avenaceus]|uniref:FAD-binding domain-containing protein n=1 Tax=Aspergillus avenaceus TaxID=36643 RepID=A0A5N6U072_ASPAV|nr:hypothetical protein BDV25DRAFT_79150 [Aspergillus avenaceus]